MGKKIIIRRLKKNKKDLEEEYKRNLEEHISYYKANPHRFITEYLGLPLYDFQKVTIYMMNMFPNFIYFAARGLAKSTISLIFGLQRAILYPGQKIAVVAPTKDQSSRFIKKAEEWMGDHPALKAEIKKFNKGKDSASIEFKNGSVFYSIPYGENALGIRLNILIVDEFVRTDKSVITRVYVPMLSDERRPPYRDLDYKSRQLYYDTHRELNRQLYLSSVRSAEEWSYQRFEDYIEFICNGDKRYMAISLPYHFGVMNGYISDNTVEQSFRENTDTPEMLLAEYMAIPERNSGDSFYKYKMFANNMNSSRALYAMSDEEYILYKDRLYEWDYYTEKLPGEIRVMSMDVALIESVKNDNSMIWIFRLLPDNGGYVKILAYGESIHGINSLIQAKRAKQLFYEMQCDWFVLDTQGSGVKHLRSHIEIFG